MRSLVLVGVLLVGCSPVRNTPTTPVPAPAPVNSAPTAHPSYPATPTPTVPSALPSSSPSPASRHRAVAPRTRPQAVYSSTGGALLHVTAYCSGTTTASGKPVREGMVATLSRAIPFGTVARIDTMGTYVVEDRIGYGSQVDIYMSSCARADAFGSRYLHVTFSNH